MACSPHYCDSHNTGTSTCAGHRTTCASNRAISWYTTSTDIKGNNITAEKIEEARAAIRNELSRWNSHANWERALLEPDAITNTTTITNETFNNLDSMVGYVYGSYLTDEIDGNVIGDDEWEALLDRYNVIRAACICNSDCACNAICSCYGNCGCNYSDERLKYDISEI